MLDASDPNLHIQQEIKGDRNQVIGQVTGGIVINQLTIHERIPATAEPPITSVVKPLTQQEYRQRKVLLNKVKAYWINGVLQASLHTKALIELGLQERSDLIQKPFSGVEEFSQAPGQALPDEASVTSVFHQSGEGRTLLILGEPGSGKTIALLKLTQDLIARTEADLGQPIPVAFNLSSWARKPQSINNWLIQELLEKYQVSTSLGKTWIETESLILLLDGLDEVKAKQRNACVQALNQFMQTHGTTELVICCRIQDYQALADRLMLRSAVCIQPLTPEQIDHYFDQAGEQLSALKTALHQHQELQELATSPLMLSIMTLAYQGCTLNEVVEDGTFEHYRQRLFDSYVERMFQRRGTSQKYPKQQVRAWLTWLAQRLVAASQTIFLIERLQLSWLPNPLQRVGYRLGSGFGSGLTIGLMIGLIGVLEDLFSGAVIRQLVNDVSFGLVIGLAIALIAEFSGEIHPSELLKWSWRKATPGFIGGALLGGSSIVLTFGLQAGLWIGWVTGLYFGAIFGLIFGLEGSEIQEKETPNQGIHQSARNAAKLFGIFSLGFGLFMGVVSGLNNGFYFGLMGGLIAGLIGGALSCIRHFFLRLILFHLGYSPWNYARFLDYCSDRLFLQKVGSGYIFVHRMLLEHFAAMSLEQENR
ncbi:MAG TPA: NACHT domain-containing protein [Leptolyngbyaceae cyanobacterium M33_DOE_097]|nr:NACHT domain-containing protein [Leptolyngbyaceae cyanobacterium M33_DOE_097]